MTREHITVIKSVNIIFMNTHLNYQLAMLQGKTTSTLLANMYTPI